MRTSQIAFDASSINHHSQQPIAGRTGDDTLAAVSVQRYSTVLLERGVALGMHENLRDVLAEHERVERISVAKRRPRPRSRARRSGRSFAPFFPCSVVDEVKFEP